MTREGEAKPKSSRPRGVGIPPTGPPCPSATEPSDYLQRLECLELARQRRQAQAEGFDAQLGVGRGQEFVGYRPYRAGEDARSLDFLLLARLGRPFVRVTRPEAHFELTILLDRSPSMAVGPPGKWQSAVEVALALAHLWCASGSRVRILHGDGLGPPQNFCLDKPSQWNAYKERVFQLTTDAGSGLRRLLPLIGATSSQVIAIGDLFDLHPSDLQPHLSATAAWQVIRILSPIETDPPAGRPVVWLNPEGGEDGIASGAEDAHWHYLQKLADQDKDWQEWSGRHRVSYTTHLAGRPFEEALLGDRSRGGLLG